MKKISETFLFHYRSKFYHYGRLEGYKEEKSVMTNCSVFIFSCFHVLSDPVQVVCHLGVDPRLVSSATAISPGDDAEQSVPAPAGADHGTSTVSLTTQDGRVRIGLRTTRYLSDLTAVNAPRQISCTEHALSELVLAVHLTLHTAAGLQYGHGGGLQSPGVSTTGLADAAPA